MASQSWKSTFLKCKCVWGREKVMIEEQVILNLQSFYSQECGLIFRLSSMLYAPSRVLLHSITCGNKLLLNPYNMQWAGLRVKAQRLFCPRRKMFFFLLFVSVFLFWVPGKIPVTIRWCCTTEKSRKYFSSFDDIWCFLNTCWNPGLHSTSDWTGLEAERQLKPATSSNDY